MRPSAVPSASAEPATLRRIMVVEDDVLVRAAAAHYLRGRGYTVVEAVDVAEALHILAADRFVRVVFADVKLPGGRSGIDLAQTIQTSYPHVKVLLTSGVAPFPDLPPGVALVKKPYFLFEVERRLVSLLEQAKDVRR